MSFVEKKTIYFEGPGEKNTTLLLDRVKDYAEDAHIDDIVVASTTGSTGAKAAKLLKDLNVVVVTHTHGFKEPGKTELEDEFKNETIANGAKIFTGTHSLSSAERAIRGKFNTIEPLELMANTLRLMGEGTKVCVEIALMATDAGLIPADKDIIAVAGTGRGADTALRIHPANSARFFDLKITEIIAKPNNF
jgi:hypothetical protein